MRGRKQYISWMVFILIMTGSWIFTLLFLPEITYKVFDAHRVEKKVSDVSKIDPSSKQDLIVEKAAATGKEKSHLETFKAWSVDLFNEHRFGYSITVPLAMIVIGTLTGLLTELLLGIFGIRTTKIIHHE